MVVGVDWFWMVRSAGWAEWLSRGEEWFDSFVSENEERAVIALKPVGSGS
jgi:hypothetical protein